VFDWLFEGHLTVYALLAAAVVVMVALWRRDRKRAYLLGAGVALVLMALYCVLDWAVETDREQIVRKVREMADAVGKRDSETIGRHISDQFSHQFSRATKQTLLDAARQHISSGRVREVAVWDFRFKGPIDRAGGRAEVVFQAKPKGDIEGMIKGAWFRCEAEFVLEGAQGWRMRGFRLFPLNEGDASKEINPF
jgi:hypothetical protein